MAGGGGLKFNSQWFLLKNNWYWVCIQKNASTSIKEHCVDLKYRVPNGNKVAVIRNPFDRLVSAWENMRHKIAPPAKTFDDCVRFVADTSDEELNKHARPQYLYLDPYPDLIINFELLNEGFEAIGITLKKRNASERKPWQSYYTDELMDLVRARYPQDFAIYE